jgi:hypothetical protein
MAYCPFCGFNDKFAAVGCMFTCSSCKKMALLVDMNNEERLDRCITKHEIKGINGGVTKFVK